VLTLVVAGMFGVGGGFRVTPRLAVVFSVPLPIAVVTIAWDLARRLSSGA
jgi:uncharacterized membrane protein YfcA